MGAAALGAAARAAKRENPAPPAEQVAQQAAAAADPSGSDPTLKGPPGAAVLSAPSSAAYAGHQDGAAPLGPLQPLQPLPEFVSRYADPLYQQHRGGGGAVAPTYTHAPRALGSYMSASAEERPGPGFGKMSFMSHSTAPKVQAQVGGQCFCRWIFCTFQTHAEARRMLQSLQKIQGGQRKTREISCIF